MTKQVRYRKLVVTTKPADGVRGILCYTGQNYFFRVYHEAGDGFTDYELMHSDLEITIRDRDAAFYEHKGRRYLDHAPETLGLEPA